MFEFIIGVAIGLVVGWWFLPQPEWLKKMYAKMRGETTS